MAQLDVATAQADRFYDRELKKTQQVIDERKSRLDVLLKILEKHSANLKNIEDVDRALGQIEKIHKWGEKAVKYTQLLAGKTTEELVAFGQAVGEFGDAAGTDEWKHLRSHIREIGKTWADGLMAANFNNEYITSVADVMKRIEHTGDDIDNATAKLREYRNRRDVAGRIRKSLWGVDRDGLNRLAHGFTTSWPSPKSRERQLEEAAQREAQRQAAELEKINYPHEIRRGGTIIKQNAY
jgi:hypothetical protein